MDHLWSPWRSQHVRRSSGPEGAETSDSLFERLAARPERDRENGVLWRGRTVYVVMNRFPYNNGHLLIVPYRRVADYEQLTPEERSEMADVLARCLGWLREALAPHGFNVGMNLGAAGGAGIPGHLHQHVVPRWRGDTNFMTPLAETRVIPEAPADTYDRLRAVVEQAAD